jgi:ribonuclease HI
MQEMDLPQRYVRFARNFLSGRKTTVEVNNTMSNTFILKEGLPQGSSISPLLFLIFINDIGVNLRDDTIASLFADDTSIGVHGGKDRVKAQELMQEEVDKVIEWADQWKMTINGDKTKALVISSSTADTAWEPELRAGPDAIKTVNSYRFLGVTVDNGLRFNEHMELLLDKCRRRVNIIKCLAWRDWGNSLEVQRTLYLQYVRSCLEYATSSWRGWSSQTSLLKAERVQNEALRSIGGLAKTCPVDFLRLETNVEPLSHRQKKIDEITWDRYKRLPTSDARRRLVDDDVPPRLKTRPGWRNETKQRMTEVDTLERDETTPPSAPWRNFPQLCVEYVELEKKKSEYSSEALKQAALDRIETFEELSHIIYTDGSTSGTQENGGAGMLVQDADGNVVHEASFPAGAKCSSYTGESVAFLEAIRWIHEKGKESPGSVGKVLICSDSMSLAQSLDKNCWKDMDPWLKQIKDVLSDLMSQVTLLWIPAHCDIEGNERADELARRGTEMNQDSTIVTHKIIKAKIKNRQWQVTHQRAKETYQERHSPKFDVEKTWPKDIRTLYARLRTGHTTELRQFQDFIDAEEDGLCEHGCGVDETIKHVLCDCVATMEARARNCEEPVTISMMISRPEMCRKILASRYGELRLPEEKPEESQEQNGWMGCTDGGVF